MAHRRVDVHHRAVPGPHAEWLQMKSEGLDDFRRFHFDTALSGSPAALPSLLASAPPGHVLYGRDFPFAPDIAVAYFTSQLDAYEGAGRAGVDRVNAEALFRRLATR